MSLEDDGDRRIVHGLSRSSRPTTATCSTSRSGPSRCATSRSATASPTSPSPRPAAGSRCPCPAAATGPSDGQRQDAAAAAAAGGRAGRSASRWPGSSPGPLRAKRRRSRSPRCASPRRCAARTSSSSPPARRSRRQSVLQHGLASCASEGCLDITVSRSSASARCASWTALVRHLEASGVGVEVVAGRTYSLRREQRTFVTEALVGGERVGFALREKQRMHKEPPSPATRSAAGRGTALRELPAERHARAQPDQPAPRGPAQDLVGRQAPAPRGRARGSSSSASDLAAVAARGDSTPRTSAGSGPSSRRSCGAPRRPSDGASRRQRIARLIGEATAWSRAAELRAYARGGRCGCWTRTVRRGEADEARRADLEWLLEYADSIDPLQDAEG